MNQLYNTYKLLDMDERAIYNALIYNSINSFDSDLKKYLICYSKINSLVPLLYSESKHVYYTFIELLKKNIVISIYNPETEAEIFKTRLLKEFDLSGKSLKNDLSFKYSFDDNFYEFLQDRSIKEYVINWLQPIDIYNKKKISFIEDLYFSDKFILLSLIKNYYPFYYNKEWEIYNSDFIINLISIQYFSDNIDITLKDIKRAFKKFSEPVYWLYLFDNKIPNQCRLIDEYFIFEYNDKDNPEIKYKYSLEFVTLLRDLNFINIHLNNYNIDTSNFIPLNKM